MTRSFIETARSVIRLESDAVAALADRLDESFSQACQAVLDCKGRVVVVGMGKSGHIGGKIAATLASTGSPAFFVHPGEASHGDLGMITPQDLVIAISNSGETPELLTILPLIKRMGVPLIAVTGNLISTLSEQADISLDVAVEKEACPLNLAPTSSTTATLAMGDALAVAVLHARGLTKEEFAMSHPGGTLGKRLLLYVTDLMHSGGELPAVKAGASISEALLEMTSKGLGMTGVLDDAGKLVGIYTDGDLRRTLDRNIDVRSQPIESVMTKDPITIDPQTLAAEVVQLMRLRAINGLFVVDKSGNVLGALNMHDLLRAGVL